MEPFGGNYIHAPITFQQRQQKSALYYSGTVMRREGIELYSQLKSVVVRLNLIWAAY